MINFSQNACRQRFDDLLAGTAKPTPESIPNPTPEILERIESRKNKQHKLEQSTQLPEISAERRNVEGNGWTSRMRVYF